MSRFLLILLVLALCSCASLPDNNRQIPSYALLNTEDTHLAQAVALQRQRDGASEDQTGVYPLGNGLDAFVARAVLADQASESIDVQYYLYHSDLSGRALLEKLLQAAERGVRVRMLVDDMDLADKDRALAMLDSHPNFEVRIWNPFARNGSRTAQFVTRFGSVTRRMHNKSFTVDNQVAIIGGRNIGDEYFGANPDIAFGDVDVILIGAVVPQVSESFDLYWNHVLAYPISILYPSKLSVAEMEAGRQWLADYVHRAHDSDYVRYLIGSELAEKLLEDRIDYHWSSAEIYADHPDKPLVDRSERNLMLFNKLQPHLEAAEHELIIVSPYFVPGEVATKNLVDLVYRGVKVKILTNSLASNDVPVVHAGYSRYRKALLEGGVELYELKSTLQNIDAPRKEKRKIDLSKSSLHAKYFVIDRHEVFIGSLNFDPRSVVENTEMGVLIDNPALAKKTAQHFDNNIAEVAYRLALRNGSLVWLEESPSGEVVYDREPNSSWWQRFKISVIRWLPGESQL